MQPYKQYSHMSVRMSENQKLQQLITELVKKEQIKGVIETGTYDGLGSTKMLAEIFAKIKNPAYFYTCEVGYPQYKMAQKNLSTYSFVECRFGLSVLPEEAQDFLKQDECLNDHEKYKDIYIDDAKDPLTFYQKECRGELVPWFKRIGLLLKRISGTAPVSDKNLLRKLIQEHHSQKPLIVLDSSGGIGFLEFQVVVDAMGSEEYWLLLDDIHHLKHFRSFKQVQQSPDFELIGYDTSHGWALAHHRAR